MSLLGAIELGGTKIRVARGGADGTIVDSVTFRTEAPDQSFASIRAFFDAGTAVAAIGLGSFGPVDVRPGSPRRGELRATPKPGWSGFNVVQALAGLGVPVRIETDVAAAGLGEQVRGALRGVGCGVYLTVGTGIGGALLVDGAIVNGAAHAEMGHLPLRRAGDDHAPSTCPYHSDCAEGLASGPAIQRRFGHSLSDAEVTPAETALIGDYLGQLAASIALVLCPARMVIGGGVSKSPGLLAMVHDRALRHLGGYAEYAELLDDRFIVAPELGDDAGLTGALILASQAS